MRQTLFLQAKNAFEVLSRLPKHGIGSKLSRTGWTDDCFWTVTKVKVSPDGKHGSAWGVLTWRGATARPGAPTQIDGPLKKVWGAVSDASEQQQWQSLVASALRQEQQAAAATGEAAAATGEAAAEAEAPPAAAAEQHA